MSLQPAFDHIGLEAIRRGLDIHAAAMSWEPADDGRGVHVEFAFPGGTVLKGYAPDGMASFEVKRPVLSIVDTTGPASPS
jgi:hypothetical protein